MKTKMGLAIVCVLVSVYALFYQIYPSNKSSNTADREVVKIAVSQTPLSSPFIVAQHLNLFDKSNFNIELIPCSGGVACAQALFNSEVNFATASESVVMFESFNYDDISLVTCFVDSGNDIKLLALEHSNISKVSELEGKKVGIVKASASEFYFDSLLIANNLKAMPVERVYLPPQDLNQALTTGEVDAISVWEPYGYLLMSSSENVVDLSLEGIYHLTFNLLTRESAELHHLESSIHILTVLEDAIQWMNSNPQKSREIVAGALDIPQSQLEWSWQDYTFRLSIGNALLSNLQLQARWALEANLVQGKVPNYRNVLDSQALEFVLRNPLSVK
ncbi:ABC transporter substrate-binding protein [Vibrio lamellibrachiae]|uniref:ABC transporter substrate-binding protein n=1 Tax=Vibrio lamellibrachiae TaxID=2910253 RepID=UPI003D0EED2D